MLRGLRPARSTFPVRFESDSDKELIPISLLDPANANLYIKSDLQREYQNPDQNPDRDQGLWIVRGQEHPELQLYKILSS